MGFKRYIWIEWLYAFKVYILIFLFTLTLNLTLKILPVFAVRDLQGTIADDSRLQSYEKRLYPQKDFHLDTLSERIERLEIALWGEMYSDLPLNQRLLKIDEEMALLELNSREKILERERWEREERKANELKKERELLREENRRRENRRRNYSLLSPFIQTGMQRALRYI